MSKNRIDIPSHMFIIIPFKRFKNHYTCFSFWELAISIPQSQSFVVLFKFVKVNPLQATEWLLFMHFSFSKDKEGNRKACRTRACGPISLFSQLRHPPHSTSVWRFPKLFWTIRVGLRGWNPSSPVASMTNPPLTRVNASTAMPALLSFGAQVRLVLTLWVWRTANNFTLPCNTSWNDAKRKIPECSKVASILEIEI